MWVIHHCCAMGNLVAVFTCYKIRCFRHMAYYIGCAGIYIPALQVEYNCGVPLGVYMPRPGYLRGSGKFVPYAFK